MNFETKICYNALSNISLTNLRLTNSTNSCARKYSGKQLKQNTNSGASGHKNKNRVIHLSHVQTFVVDFKPFTSTLIHCKLYFKVFT